MSCEVCQDRGWVVVEMKVEAFKACKVLPSDSAAELAASVIFNRYAPMAAVKHDTFTATIELIIKLDKEVGNDATGVADWLKSEIMEGLSTSTEPVEVKSVLVYGP